MKKTLTQLNNKTIWLNLISIGVFVLIFAGLGSFYALHHRHTTYDSERTIVVSHSYAGAAANEEVQADINLGKTYANIVESKDVAKVAHQNMSKSMRKKYTVNDITSMVNAHNIMQTTLIKVSVKADTAKHAASLVNAVTDAAKNQIARKVPSSGNVVLFNRAKVSDATSTTSPSLKKYTLLGAAVGLLLGMVVSFSVTTWEKLL